MITIADDGNGPKWVTDGIHGRQEELNKLKELAQQGNSACVLLEGSEGCGKSELVKSIDWREKGWVLTFQTFERHLSSEPYSALARAIDELVEIWLDNTENSRDDGKQVTQLLDLVEKDQEVLKNIIPGVFRIIDNFTQTTHKSRSQRMLFANNNNKGNAGPGNKMMSRRDMMMRAQSTSFISRSRAMLQKSPSIKDLTSTQRQRRQEHTGSVRNGGITTSGRGGVEGVANPRRQRGQLVNEKMGVDPAAIAGSFLELFSFLSSTKPVVLALDNVHFADASSMEVLKLMAEATSSTKKNEKKKEKMRKGKKKRGKKKEDDEDNSTILLMLSYTELLEENQIAYQKIATIKELDSQTLYHFHLDSWDVDTVNEFLASLFKAEPETSKPLAEVVHKKTAGDPFEVYQFVRYAREQGHFKFSTMTYRWEWEDVEVLDQYAAVADNVAQILAASMVRLPYATKSALKVASCLGQTIPIDVLVEYFSESNLIEENSENEDEEDTSEEQKMIELLDAATKEGILVKSTTQGAYMWANGRLHQAAYESLSPSMRNRLHLTLGRLLWELGMVRDLEWMIFMAATQMNKYSHLHAEASLGNEVAELNLQAAILSLNKGAIYPALELLEKAEEHMDEFEDRWAEAYDLTIDIMTTLAETKLRVGEIDTAMALAAEVVQNADSHDDTFPAHIIMLECLVSGNDRDYDMGVEKTLWLLKFYGETNKWKFYPGQETVEKKKLKSKIKKNLPDGELEGLLDLSDMVDIDSLRIQILLVNHLALYASYSPTYNSLSWFASARALKSACKRGICPVTNLALIQMATHLRVDGKYKEASKYADIALLLTDFLPRSLGSNHGQVRMIACGSVFSAVRSFNHCLNELLECRKDFLRAGLAKESISVAIGYTITYLCIGLNLGAAKSDLVAHTVDARQYGCPYSVEQKMRILHQTIVNLMDTGVAEPTVLRGEIMDQDEELEKVEGLAALRIRLRMAACQLMLCCIYCDWESAETLIDDLEENGDDQDGFLMRSHFRRCYVGLAAFAVSRKKKDTKQKKFYRAIGKKTLKSFQKEMKCGSVNAFPIVAMLEAEKSPSKESYDLAIKACARLGLVHHEAYMCERSAEIFRMQNDIEWCKHYISQSILLYGEWGATGKVKKLKTEYADLLVGSSIRDSVNTSLQSRSRYSSTELEALKSIDWRTFNQGEGDGVDFGSFRSHGASGAFGLDTSTRSVGSTATMKSTPLDLKQ